MPHAYFKCPDGAAPDRDPATGNVPVPACLSCSRTRLHRNCNYNATLLKAMVETGDERLSPTRLAGCPRQAALKRRYDYAVNPRDAYPKVRGTIFHNGIEQMRDPDGYQELELARDLDDLPLQGRLDLAYPEQELVVDWKTMAYVPVKNNPKTPEKDLPKFAHVAQLSVYGWLARARGWKFTYGEIMYLDMGKPRREVIELWDDATTEAWVRERMPHLLQAYDDTAPLPPVLASDDPDNWQCNHCEVADVCGALDALDDDEESACEAATTTVS